jgi:hypothetical protein
MKPYGFRANVPQHWNKRWLLMWLINSLVLIASAFFLDVVPWTGMAAVLFFLPEAVSLIKKDDGLPPLTHAIRHFLPNYLAFPLIYGALGGAGAKWLGFERPAGIAALMALLGWLTDHFGVTYSQPDPYPYSHRLMREGTDTVRLPT